MRITIAVPAAMIADANALLRVVGQSADDDDSFGQPGWQDNVGRRYSVASGNLGDDILTRLTGLLRAPSWGADMVAATRAQALIQPGTPASSDRIACVLINDVDAAITALGLTRLIEE